MAEQKHSRWEQCCQCVAGGEGREKRRSRGRVVEREGGREGGRLRGDCADGMWRLSPRCVATGNTVCGGEEQGAGNVARKRQVVWWALAKQRTMFIRSAYNVQRKHVQCSKEARTMCNCIETTSDELVNGGA